MLRGLRTRGLLFETLGLAGFYAILASLIEISPLIQILNSVFVGVFIAAVTPYWYIFKEQFQTASPYEREHQYSLGVWLLWTGAFCNRIISIAARVIQGEKALVSDTQFTAITIYILIIAGLLQVTAISQPLLGDARDRQFLAKSAVIGTIVAVILIIAQAVGTGWFYV